MAKVLNWNNFGNEFELQSTYYAKFQTITLGKSLESPIPLAMGSIVQFPFFYKDGFCIKLLSKFHMPLNEENKPVLFMNLQISLYLRCFLHRKYCLFFRFIIWIGSFIYHLVGDAKNIQKKELRLITAATQSIQFSIST